MRAHSYQGIGMAAQPRPLQWTSTVDHVGYVEEVGGRTAVIRLNSLFSNGDQSMVIHFDVACNVDFIMTHVRLSHRFFFLNQMIGIPPTKSLTYPLTTHHFVLRHIKLFGWHVSPLLDFHWQ